VIWFEDVQECLAEIIKEIFKKKILGQEQN